MRRWLIERAAKSTRTKSTVLIGGLSITALVALGVVLIASALAGPPPPPSKPSIDSKPANPSYSSTAAFTYSNKDSVTFQCSFDGGPFTACGSGKSGSSSYPTTSSGHTYTFSVRATSSSGTSPAESYSWKYLQPPPVPTITQSPDAITNQPAPTFRFTDSQSPVTFKCSLDGSGFGDCTSPKSYGNQSDGTHTFRVEAVGANTAISDPASFTWTVDTKPPTVVTTFPIDHGLYTGTSVYPAQSWNTGCAPASAGFCGTAADATTSVAAGTVQISLQRVSNGTYWNGATWVSSPTWVPASGTTSWNKAFGIADFPADGDYIVKARATDAAGNTSLGNDKAQAPFTIDRNPPPTPTFKKTDVKGDHAHFEYVDAEAGGKYQCTLDSGAPVICDGTQDYDHLANGVHQFCVKALDKAGNASSSLCFAWQIGTGGIDFHVTGSPLAGVALYPGGADVPVNVVFMNNTPASVKVTGLTTTVSGVTPVGPGPCNLSDFSVSHQLSATPTVPANSTKSLQDLSVAQSNWPQLRMADNGNQDGCRGAHLQLSFVWTVEG